MNINPLQDIARKTGGKLALCVIVPIEQYTQGPTPRDEQGDPEYPGEHAYAPSRDYATIWWFGRKYYLPEYHHRHILRLMIEAYESGHNAIPVARLCEATGVKSIVSAVRGAGLWGDVIEPCSDQGVSCVRLHFPVAA